MPCLFCGRDGPLTKEHLWSDWIGRLLPQTNPTMHRRHYRIGDTERAQEFEALAFTMQVRAVCSACNNGWMSRLEDAVKPIIGGMIQGRGRRLSPGQQTTVAAWAALKALVFHRLHPPEDRHAPTQHYRELRSNETFAPNSMTVFLARYGGTTWPGFYDHRTLAREDPAAGPEFYSATISVGHLVMNVIGGIQGDSIDIVARGHPGLDAAMRKIWPEPETFTFPAGPSLSEGGLQRLAGPPVD